uniref:Cation/H+ exchanger transmembrane domain-containing protein n=1 Tax=Timema genevievae TaxID=629358 RepID=A0A7R9K5D3_TIMGE|nr:unnamed protein product [Timema genevievae]
MYGFIQQVSYLRNSFTFLDTLYFGALISSTDPLTILAIFNDLHVDVNLYALVFGESVLNDAVAIVLSGAIQNYGERYQSGSGGFETNAFFRAFGDFIGIFTLSLLIGALMGCITALLTKFTRVRDFPLLESALFVLMSYSTFLIAEVSELTGLRGAMSFALAIRNTVSEARQAMLTATSLIVIITVIVQGGATLQLLTWFKIP